MARRFLFAVQQRLQLFRTSNMRFLTKLLPCESFNFQSGARSMVFEQIRRLLRRLYDAFDYKVLYRLEAF